MKEFIPQSLCHWFIDLYKRNDNKKITFNEKKVLRLYDILNEEETLKQGIGYITRYAKDRFKDYTFYVDNFEIVEWNEGQGMPWHRDYPYYEATTIVYLNENFEGGELVTGHDPADYQQHLSKTHKPVTGTAVSFMGNTWHKVNPVTKGKRYTMAIWYKIV
tara:strand:- start:651 stop:1133 length:483 start_codon:yes stop_codon:yes gene_type:complete